MAVTVDNQRVQFCISGTVEEIDELNNALSFATGAAEYVLKMQPNDGMNKPREMWRDILRDLHSKLQGDPRGT